jgi:hypothetical protein
MTALRSGHTGPVSVDGVYREELELPGTRFGLTSASVRFHATAAIIGYRLGVA